MATRKEVIHVESLYPAADKMSELLDSGRNPVMKWNQELSVWEIRV